MLYLCPRKAGFVSSAGSERLLHTQEVRGSNPRRNTNQTAARQGGRFHKRQPLNESSLTFRGWCLWKPLADDSLRERVWLVQLAPGRVCGCASSEFAKAGERSDSRPSSRGRALATPTPCPPPHVTFFFVSLSQETESEWEQANG